MEDVKDVDSNHPVDVFAREFKDGSVAVLVRWWSAARAKDFIIQDEVVRGIKRGLDAAKMNIAGADATTIVIDNLPEAEAEPARRPTEDA